MKKLLAIAFALVLSLPIYGQEDKDPFYLYENTPTSPESSSIGEFGNIGNNSYTGKANISVPIHSIDFDGLQIPIQLSYDTGGIRAAQEASWVGLNWNLSTTFGISRTVNGVDDLRSDLTPVGVRGQVGYLYSDYDTVQLVQGTGLQMPYDDIVDVHESFLVNEGAPKQVDTQPDTFNVSLFGTSYKFKLEKYDGNNEVAAFVFNNSLVKINYYISENKFEIVNEQGFIFEFETKEYSTTFSSSITSSNRDSFLLGDMLAADNQRSDETIVTSWLLDKIISPTGKELDFQYTNGIYLTVPSYSGSYRVPYESGADASDDYYELTGGPEYSASTTVIHKEYLSKIVGDFGSVDFILGNREDLLTGSGLAEYLGNSPNFSLTTSQGSISQCHGGQCGGAVSKRLNRVDIKDYNGNLVKDAWFNYSYYNDSTTNNKALFKRLKLTSVEVGDRHYSFEYDDQFPLPVKNTDDVDFWGFYNGANNDLNNKGNVPSIGRFVTSIINGVTNRIAQTFVEYEGAIKKADFNFGKRGTLEKIIYPTGGYTILEYEGNQALVAVPPDYIVTDWYNNSSRIQFTSLVNESKYNFTYQYLKKAEDSQYSFYSHQDLGGGTQVGTVVSVGESINLPNGGILDVDGTLKQSLELRLHGLIGALLIILLLRMSIRI